MDTTLLIFTIVLVLYLGVCVRQWRHLNREGDKLIPSADPTPRGK
jgi:hypothetical protein